MAELNKKRVELSIHTNMSALDGINDVGDYINEAMRDWMPAIAITDHNSVQAFPNAYSIVKTYGGIKLIYGAELFYKKGNNKFSLTVLVKNRKGLKELYKLISEAHTKNFDKVPLTSLDEITELKENLILGISILNEPIYKILDNSTDTEIEEIIKPFDFVMLHPIEYFNYFISQKQIKDKAEAIKITQRVIELCEKNKIMTVASDDAHFVFSDDGECRKILLHYKGYAGYNEQPNLYLRNTTEMLDEFRFLDDKKAYKIVVENTNAIANMIDDTFAPFDDSAEYQDEMGKLKEITYSEAVKKYGKEIPEQIKIRIDWELNAIGKSTKSVMSFIIASELTKNATEKGFSTCSRGSVASSLVAYLIGITTVNPLEAHYYCPSCKNIEFHREENCGVDLLDKQCPLCGTKFNKDGFNIPAETFFGINGEREPDIDLNLPPEYRNEAIDNLDKIVGIKAVRCGTVNRISGHQAYVITDKYCKIEKIKYSDIRENEIANKLEKIKKATEEHPSGILVFPKDKEIIDYTPIQYPKNDKSYGYLITHFEKYSLPENLLKIDLIDHGILSMINELEKLTGTELSSIPLNDKKTMKLINECNTVGIPAFSEQESLDIIRTSKLEKFNDLIRVFALSNGTNVFEEAATRDDVMLKLIECGIDREDAYKLSERIRKGKGFTNEQYDELVKKGISIIFLDSCNDIRYSFPKAHCVEYAKLEFKLAYYKAHNPLEFYCTFLNMHVNEFETEMINSNYLSEISKKTEETDWQNYCEEDYNKQSLAEICAEIIENGYEFVLEEEKTSVTGFIIDNDKIKVC